MAAKDENNIYGIQNAATGIPPSDEEFALEEILTEYGGGLERALLRSADLTEEAEEAAPGPEAVPEAEDTPEETIQETEDPPEAGPAPEEDPAPEEKSSPEEPPASEAPPAPETPPVDPELLEEGLAHPLTLEEVVGSTVEAVMEERPRPAPPRHRPLFHRKRPPVQDREEDDESGPIPLEKKAPPERREAPIPPEPDLLDAASDCRAELRQRETLLKPALVFCLLPTVMLALDRQGWALSLWRGNDKNQTVILLALAASALTLCHAVVQKALREALRGRCTGELLVTLSALASMGDCVCRLTRPERSAAVPYVAVSSLGLLFALWGLTKEGQGRLATMQTAALDPDPPYLITETGAGACKQRGSVPGFYTAAMEPDGAAIWQAALLPVVLAGALIFAGLSAMGRDRGSDFFLNLSALLAAGGTYSLSLCWGLPFSRLAAHLQKAGCAVAGWSGAERIGRTRYMVLTDVDLFPPGTVQLGGVRLYGEESQKAASYAASMAQAAGSGLERVFDNYLRGELGHYVKVDDFAFFQEGGWSGVIEGEDVLMGTDSFLRKMGVRLPSGLRLKTGILLSVDKHLRAVFLLKYQVTDNAEFALQMMQRGGVIPILASRDPNITPSLLKRKFRHPPRMEYPGLTERVALSEAEKDRGRPRALVFREGLLPYAEAVAGSRRLCKAVRRGVLLSLLGSAAGLLLAYYLVGIGQYALLTPLALEGFLLLWTLPVLLIADWAGRY